VKVKEMGINLILGVQRELEVFEVKKLAQPANAAIWLVIR